MAKIVIDFETYYSTDYTLKKLTNEEYVRDPRFHVHGVGIKIGHAPAYYVPDSEDIAGHLESLRLHEHAVVAHHAQFDGLILNEIYGIRPGFWCDTISMARPLFPTTSLSLDNLVKVLEIGEKGKDLVNFQNVMRLTPEQQDVMRRYCINDVELTWAVFHRLATLLPVSELRVIDQTIREFTEPVFMVDCKVAQGEVDREADRVNAVLAAAGVTDRKELASNDKFAALLESLGVQPPTKESAKTGKQTWAFAKKDEGFKLLMEHEDPVVAGLVAARLGVKSTIKSTRAARMVAIGQRGALPSYSHYYGAHTGRPSGGDKLNLKNLPQTGALRHAIIAPPGHLVVMRDLSQIEARMLAYMAGQEDLLEAFRQGVDPYCHEAGKIYGRPINKDIDKKERQVGKVVVLGCGYQLSWPNLQAQLRVGFLGMPPLVFDDSYVEALGVPIDLYVTEKWFNKIVLQTHLPHLDFRSHLTHCAVTRFLVDSFRSANDKIVDLWDDCHRSLDDIIESNARPVGKNGLVITAPHGFTLTPNGMPINYTNLRKVYSESRKKEGHVYDKREGRRTVPAHIYGGRCVENCIQALSYILIKHNKLALGREYRVAMDVYDEIVCVVPESEAEECARRMDEIMTTPPPWARDLPLKSGGGYARNYGDCEKK